MEPPSKRICRHNPPSAFVDRFVSTSNISRLIVFPSVCVVELVWVMTYEICSRDVGAFSDNFFHRCRSAEEYAVHLVDAVKKYRFLYTGVVTCFFLHDVWNLVPEPWRQVRALCLSGKKRKERSSYISVISHS
jgi:hypothetical protein